MFRVKKDQKKVKCKKSVKEVHGRGGIHRVSILILIIYIYIFFDIFFEGWVVTLSDPSRGGYPLPFSPIARQTLAALGL